MLQAFARHGVNLARDRIVGEADDDPGEPRRVVDALVAQ